MTTLIPQFFVIEGADRVGKTTAIVEVEKALSCDVYRLKFPSVDHAHGQDIYDMVLGRKPFNPWLVQFYNLANRFDAAEDIAEMAEQGCVIIADRYVLSGLVYAHVDGIDLEWVRRISVLLPEPSTTFVITGKQFQVVGKGADAYEGDVAREQTIYGCYHAASVFTKAAGHSAAPWGIWENERVVRVENTGLERPSQIIAKQIMYALEE